IIKFFYYPLNIFCRVCITVRCPIPIYTHTCDSMNMSFVSFYNSYPCLHVPHSLYISHNISLFITLSCKCQQLHSRCNCFVEYHGNTCQHFLIYLTSVMGQPITFGERGKLAITSSVYLLLL